MAFSGVWNPMNHPVLVCRACWKEQQDSNPDLTEKLSSTKTIKELRAIQAMGMDDASLAHSTEPQIAQEVLSLMRQEQYEVREPTAGVMLTPLRQVVLNNMDILGAYHALEALENVLLRI